MSLYGQRRRQLFELTLEMHQSFDDFGGPKNPHGPRRFVLRLCGAELTFTPVLNRRIGWKPNVMGPFRNFDIWSKVGELSLNTQEASWFFREYKDADYQDPR